MIVITPKMLKNVAAGLRNFSSGTLRVTEARARQGADGEGNPSVRIIAVVDPPDGAHGWKVDDVLALQGRAEELMRIEEPEAPWAFVELRSSDDQLPPEEDDVEGALREALGD
jgi:hypothetical protein